MNGRSVEYPRLSYSINVEFDEIILGNFKGKESLPLANRGNTFVSLRGVLEILSKTELSSDIVDNFQVVEMARKARKSA